MAKFCKERKKIIVDIDKAELTKKTVKGDILIHSDAKIFITDLLDNLPNNFHINKKWLEWCQKEKKNIQ